jgi:hypothetical protein
VTSRVLISLYNEQLSDLYSSPNIVRVMKPRIIRWAGHVTRMGREEVHTGKPEEQRQLGRPRRRWEDNIKIGPQEVECGEWTGSSWLRIGTGSGHL